MLLLIAIVIAVIGAVIIDCLYEMNKTLDFIKSHLRSIAINKEK